MNEFEYKKFDDHYKEKLTKLKNPNHIVSNTRILLKNLPKKNFDEEDLKKIISNFKENELKVKNTKIYK